MFNNYSKNCENYYFIFEKMKSNNFLNKSKYDIFFVLTSQIFSDIHE